jgi:hypothetical protein
VCIVLPAEQVLLCQRSLPRVRASDLPALIELQLERHSPLPREQVYVDWHVDSPANAAFTQVSIAIVKRATVDGWHDVLSTLGWQISAINTALPASAAPFDLLPRRAALLSWSVTARDRKLLWLALSLCVLYLGSVGGHWWYERAQLAAPLARARAQVARIQMRREELAHGAGPIVALRELMQTSAVPQVLSTTSAAIPSDTWIYQTEIRMSADAAALMRLDGYTASATHLVELLEQRPEFEQVELVSAQAGQDEASANRVQIKARWNTPAAASGAQP